MTYESALDAKALQERAEERAKIRIHLAMEQGVTTYELEEELGISQQTISRWGRLGKEALERRQLEKRESGARGNPIGEDPLRSGELTPLR